MTRLIGAAILSIVWLFAANAVMASECKWHGDHCMIAKFEPNTCLSAKKFGYSWPDIAAHLGMRVWYWSPKNPHIALLTAEPPTTRTPDRIEGWGDFMLRGVACRLSTSTRHEPT